MNKNELKKVFQKIILMLDGSAQIEIKEAPPATPERGASDGGRGETWQINIAAEKSGILIGRYGETLNALQSLFRVIGSQSKEPIKLVVDVAGYKAAKAHDLEELALQVAENVKKSGYPQTLRPMNPYERRIIHVALADFKGIEAISVGEEPYRCIEIKPRSGGAQTP